MTKVIAGEKPKRPEDKDCVGGQLPDEMWGLMMDCWNINPQERPGMKSIIDRFLALSPEIRPFWEHLSLL
jgi:hypothetical protein